MNKLELLSLTSEQDLVITKLDNYYLLLVHPSKRKYKLSWYEAKHYCKSIEASQPTEDELNLIYTNKGSLSLVEACLYENEINTLDYISNCKQVGMTNWVWSLSESGLGDLCLQNFLNGNKYYYNSVHNNVVDCIKSWVLPVRRILI